MTAPKRAGGYAGVPGKRGVRRAGSRPVTPKVISDKSAKPLGPPRPPLHGPPTPVMPGNHAIDVPRGRMTGTGEAVRFRPGVKLDPSQMQDRRPPTLAKQAIRLDREADRNAAIERQYRENNERRARSRPGR